MSLNGSLEANMHEMSSIRRGRGPVACVVLVILIGVTSTLAGADDWPCWRGPTHDGISVETGWSPKALSEGKVLWRASVGLGHSSFAVAGGKAYTMGNSSNQDSVFCFDAETGKEIWRHSYGCRAGNYPGPRSTPAVDGRFVYALSREGHLHCLEAESGKVKWMKKAPSKVPTWGISSSPLIHGDLVVVNTGTSGAAYDKTTGALKWSRGDGVPGYASPVLMKVGSGDSFLIFSEKDLICVSGKTGRPRWSLPWQVKYNVNAGDPVLVGKSGVFISSGYGKGCAMLRATSKGVRAAWKNTNMRNHMASTVHHQGHLYGFDEKNLACLDAKRGSTKWSQPGFGKGALMIADGKLVFLSERGIDLVVAEATPKSYTEVARARVLTGHTWTAPVLANGRIYCRTDRGDIVCVDVSGK